MKIIYRHIGLDGLIQERKKYPLLILTGEKDVVLAIKSAKQWR